MKLRQVEGNGPGQKPVGAGQGGQFLVARSGVSVCMGAARGQPRRQPLAVCKGLSPDLVGGRPGQKRAKVFQGIVLKPGFACLWQGQPCRQPVYKLREGAAKTPDCLRPGTVS